MTEPLVIRRVSVEFLRPGPSHNQLLSPYTQYLAVCNDAGAAVVTVPYEQRVFERRLKELRYETGDQNDRLDMLHEIGRDMGRILESVPGFTGAVTTEGASGTLVHLRLTISAAELALLPFELAEVPVGSTSSAVCIQTRPPVSVTRHIRTVSSDGLGWPDRPRILFVSSDPREVPFDEHRGALADAIKPFLYPKRDEVARSADGRREQFGTLLTILSAPTLLELQRECESARYTHVHVLTHGELGLGAGESYGIVLRDEDGNPDVVSGERFVSTVTRIGHRPSVVTIASCDSGNVGSLVIPGASFAHAVHQASVPLVVGSQFPLSKQGSVPLTSRLYQGLLWGEHPLRVLQEARAELHARFNTNWHDWASVVVYEALPSALPEYLDALRYAQAKRAVDAALECIDLAVASPTVVSEETLDGLQRAVDQAVARLPGDGQFQVECMALGAGSRKRIAQATFDRASDKRTGASHLLKGQYDLLDHARLGYAEAVKGMLVNDSRAVQRKATLHWVLVQKVSLATVLEVAIEPGEWEAACLAATHYLKHPDAEQRAWAHASLAELWLLRLAGDDLTSAQQAEYAAEALRHAKDLNDYYLGVDEFPIKSSRRQFERYVWWWGTPAFTEALKGHDVTRRASWKGDDGLISVATQLVTRLARRLPTRPAPAGPAPHAPPPDAGGNGASEAKPATPAVLGADSARPAERTRRAAPSPGATTFRIDALPAGHGDCLWIEYGGAGARHRILIDCGTQASAAALLKRIDALPADERFFELFVLSHIDSDHIGGALPLFKTVKNGLRFGDVWFNGWRHISGQLGARQGEMFSSAILDFELPWNAWQDGGTILAGGGELPERALPGGMRLTLLSPTAAQLKKLQPIWTKELKRYGLEPGGHVDYSRFLKGTPSTIADAKALADISALADTPFKGDNGAPNGTSIALLAEFDGASVLLAADAHAPVLVDSITALLKKRNLPRLKLDLFKVSHHGSQNNVSSELVSLLDCPRYLVSTNGDHFYHPDRQAMARILKYGGERKEVYFNYACRFNEVWGSPELEPVRQQWNVTMHYPEPDSSGISVTLR